MSKAWSLFVAALCCAALAGCGGGGGESPDRAGLHFETTIDVPNVGPGTSFSFDLGTVDAAKGRYYFTDRNNKSVDVFDTHANRLIAQIPGFFGTSPLGSGNSGPDGLNLIPGTNFLYVGDVNSVKIVDTSTNKIVKTIVVSNTGFRADEGCYDPDHGVYMIASPDESPPFATFINTTTQTIIAKLVFPDSAGLEQCQYDHASQSFFVNNDGSTPNPHGEVDVITVASVLALAPAVSKAYPLGDCDPTGMDLGPGTDLAVDCREGTPGSPLLVQILDRNTGAIIASVNAGGGDQLAYDAATNRYYVASSRWTSSGKSAGPSCTNATPCTPVLNVIDAGTRTVVDRLPAGNNAHSVAIDPATSQAYMPFSSAVAPAGCLSNFCVDFPNGGVAVYRTM